MALVHEGADAGLGIQRMAGRPRLQRLRHQGKKARLDRALDQQPRTGDAHLALVEGDGRGGCLGRGPEVRGVGEDDVGALATRLQPDALHVRLAGMDQQLLGDAGGTGKDQGIDVRVQRQRLAHGMAVAGQHVEHPRRDAGLQGQGSDANGGQRRLLGRLEDHRVAGGQRRPQFPAGHHQREIPGHDGRDDPDRLAGHQAELVARRGRHLVVDLVDGLGAPADGIGRRRHVDGE